MNKKKRGLSPIIATVLLIAIVIIIGTIVFLWFRGMTEETVTKFDGTNVRLVCKNVELTTSYSSGELYVSNDGNVPVFGLELKIIKQGSHETKDISKDFPNADWPSVGLNQGEIFTGTISNEISGAEEIIVIPVLLGESEKGEKTFMCEEQYGYEITI